MGDAEERLVGGRQAQRTLILLGISCAFLKGRAERLVASREGHCQARNGTRLSWDVLVGGSWVGLLLQLKIRSCGCFTRG